MSEQIERADIEEVVLEIVHKAMGKQARAIQRMLEKKEKRILAWVLLILDCGRYSCALLLNYATMRIPELGNIPGKSLIRRMKRNVRRKTMSVLCRND